MNQLIEQLIRHEGVKLKPYRCTAGKLTIGIGRNIEDNGISMGEAEVMLLNDLSLANHELERTFPWYAQLSSVRADALVNICFNIGITRLKGFKLALAAMEAGDYEEAAEQFLDSRWHMQVGARALELANQIRTGEWQDV